MIELLALVLILLIQLPSLNSHPQYDCAQFFMPTVDYSKWPRWKTFEDLLTRPLILWSIAATLNWVPQEYRLQVFHLTNALIHWVNSILIYMIATAMGFAPAESAIACLVFAVHPLAWSAVAPVVAPRSQILSATFLFLAILVTIHGWSLLAILLVSVGFLAKEDVVAGVPLVVALSFIYNPDSLPLILAFLTCIGYAFHVELWEQFKRKVRNNGDQPLKEMGIAGSLPQPQATMTAFTENLWRFPLWAIGLKQNVDPDPIPSSLRSVRFWMVALSCISLVALAALYGTPPRLKSSIVLIIISPWTLTWLIPMPDTVSESRAYSTVAGVALLFASLRTVPWFVVMAISYLAIRATIRSYNQRDGIAYWTSAYNAGSHKLRVLINIGAAYQQREIIDKALEWNDRALALDPNSGMALANRSLLYEGLCRNERATLMKPFVLFGAIDPNEANAAIARSQEKLRESVRLMNQAEAVSPNNTGIVYFVDAVRQHAKVAGVA